MTDAPRPITFVYDPATRVRTATYRGIITDDAILEAYARVMSEPGYVPDADSLVDLRLVTGFEVSTDTLRTMVERVAALDTRGRRPRIALVAPTELAYGLSRMYELLSGPDAPRLIRVFRDFDEAVGWLGAERA